MSSRSKAKVKNKTDETENFINEWQKEESWWNIYSPA